MDLPIGRKNQIDKPQLNTTRSQLGTTARKKDTLVPYIDETTHKLVNPGGQIFGYARV